MHTLVTGIKREEIALKWPGSLFKVRLYWKKMVWWDATESHTKCTQDRFYSSISLHWKAHWWPGWKVRPAVPASAWLRARLCEELWLVWLIDNHYHSNESVQNTHAHTWACATTGKQIPGASSSMHSAFYHFDKHCGKLKEEVFILAQGFKEYNLEYSALLLVCCVEAEPHGGNM